MVSDLDMQSYCEQALEARFGIAVEVTAPNKFKRLFYKVRKGDEAFACLSLRTAPNSTSELWIMKNAEERTRTTRDRDDPPL